MFRRLTDDDLPLMHRWLNDPGVVRWWEGDDVSWEGVVRDYGSASTDPVEYWLALADGAPVGWIQCYAVADNLDDDEVKHWLDLGIKESAAGIDYLIGEPGSRGKGLGASMIQSFVHGVVFANHPAWTQACASPYAANVASCRALQKAGFTFVGAFEDPGDADGPAHLYSIERPATSL